MLPVILSLAIHLLSWLKQHFRRSTFPGQILISKLHSFRRDSNLALRTRPNKSYWFCTGKLGYQCQIMHTRECARRHTRIQTNRDINMICACVCVCVYNIYRYICINVDVYLSTYLSDHISLSIFVFICICVWLEIIEIQKT